MDPWSKVEYSRHILEASMAMEKLPEVNPPSGRVSGQGLLAAPILKRRWRWNKEGIAKRVLPKARPPPRARHQGAWPPGGPPSSSTLVILEGFAALILYVFSPE